MLKEKSQQMHLSNGDLMRKLEPQMRELTASLSQSVSNSFASEWISKWVTVANEDNPARIIASPEARALYQQLQVKLGCEVHCSAWHSISQDAINAFSEVTGDKQWIHIDEYRAGKESPYKSTIAHGFLVLSLLPALRGLGDVDKHYPGARLIVNSGLNDLRFLAPVKSGQSIRIRSFLRRATLSKRSVEICEDLIVEIEHSERKACTATLLLKAYV